MKAIHLTLLISMLGVVPRVHAQEDCAPVNQVDVLRFARQASLDLRGVIPSLAELDRIRDADDPEATLDLIVDEWTESEEFYAALRREHDVLFWSNLDGLPQISHETLTLGVHPYSYLNRGNIDFEESEAEAIARKDSYRGIIMRSGGWPRRVRGWGISQRHNFCLDIEQTEFDTDGRPIPIETYECATSPFVSDPVLAATTDLEGRDRNGNELGPGICAKEGFVYVEPYWAPGTRVKVCAFDAMAFEADPEGQACDGSQKENPYCGCGPNLRHCNSGADASAGADELFRDALAQEPSRIVESVVREGRPYHEAFSQQHTMMNGALAHYYRYIANENDDAFRHDSRFVIGNPALTADVMPFESEEWVRVERDDVHAGALTTAGYMLRIASHRGRANRFYTAFYCDPFVPSADGIPAEEADPDPNLRARAGCAGCHNVLEPAAAHWARWRINGNAGFLQPSIYSIDEASTVCNCGGEGQSSCSTFCNSYFVTPENSHASTFEAYGRLPLPSIYLDEDERAAIDLGPAALVDEASEQFQVGSCAVRRVAENLLGRPLRASEAAWHDEHTRAFEAADWDYRAMVAAMLRDPKYRAIR